MPDYYAWVARDGFASANRITADTSFHARQALASQKGVHPRDTCARLIPDRFAETEKESAPC
jgi:hypothetical protein